MGFNSGFKGLICYTTDHTVLNFFRLIMHNQ